MKIPKEVLATVILGWMAWQSIAMIQVLARLAVLEDRQGIHTAKAGNVSDIWASMELVHIPELLPIPKEKK